MLRRPSPLDKLSKAMNLESWLMALQSSLTKKQDCLRFVSNPVFTVCTYHVFH